MKEFLSRIQPKFLGRPRLEKILLVLVLVVLAATWTGFFLERVRSVSRNVANLRGTAKNQDLWLKNEATIESRYANAMAKLNSAPIPSRSEVMARLDELTRKHSVGSFELSRPISDRKEGLTFHTFSISLQRVQYEQLEAFYNEVQSTLPSVNLFEVRITANATNREQLAARLSLVAIELNR